MRTRADPDRLAVLQATPAPRPCAAIVPTRNATARGPTEGARVSAITWQCRPRRSTPEAEARPAQIARRSTVRRGCPRRPISVGSSNPAAPAVAERDLIADGTHGEREHFAEAIRSSDAGVGGRRLVGDAHPRGPETLAVYEWARCPRARRSRRPAEQRRPLTSEQRWTWHDRRYPWLRNIHAEEECARRAASKP
jgi:hypothetical protein